MGPAQLPLDGPNLSPQQLLLDEQLLLDGPLLLDGTLLGPVQVPGLLVLNGVLPPVVRPEHVAGSMCTLEAVDLYKICTDQEVALGFVFGAFKNILRMLSVQITSGFYHM